MNKKLSNATLSEKVFLIVNGDSIYNNIEILIENISDKDDNNQNVNTNKAERS